MAIKLFLIILVFTVGKYGLAKLSEEASIRLNINVNTDQGVNNNILHKSFLLHKTQGGGGPPPPKPKGPPKPGHGRALKGKNLQNVYLHLQFENILFTKLQNGNDSNVYLNF